jgi:hypothetical protein
MDVAYDHTFTDGAVTADKKGKAPADRSGSVKEEESLNEELQQAYKAISNSPWGARFGAFMGTVKKQVHSNPACGGRKEGEGWCGGMGG